MSEKEVGREKAILRDFQACKMFSRDSNERS